MNSIEKNIEERKKKNNKKILLEFCNHKNQEIIIYSLGKTYIIELKQLKRRKKIYSSLNEQQCLDEYFKICKYFSKK